MRVKDLADIIHDLPPDQRVRIVVEADRMGASYQGRSFTATRTDQYGTLEIVFTTKDP